MKGSVFRSLSIIGFFLVAVFVSGQATPVFNQVEASALLAEIDTQVVFNDTDLSAQYLIVQRDPGGATTTTVATMFRRDVAAQFLILVLEPVVDKGKGYLKLGDNLWLYDPVGRTFTFTNARERFQNSSARNSDFNRSNFAVDYRPTATRQERLGTFNCTVLDLEARNDHVSFPRMRIWVSEDRLIRKMEDYSLSGQLMRTTAILNYQRVGRRWLPVTMIIQDHLSARRINNQVEYSRTTITISQPSLEALPDSLFTKEYLERVNR